MVFWILEKDLIKLLKIYQLYAGFAEDCLELH